jgi:hypothetical protein
LGCWSTKSLQCSIWSRETNNLPSSAIFR